jgi:5-methylcytosine-specific restriction endonuclease McrA
MDAIPDSTTIPLRKCSKCGCEFPATREYFNSQKLGAFGLRAMCKPCHRKHNLEWRNANIERARANNREYERNNRDKVNAKRRRLYARDPKAGVAKTMRWARNNPEKRLATFRQFHKNNPDKNREYHHRRRALILASAENHSAADIQRQYEGQRGRCWWCGNPVGSTYHVDHIIPLSRGGDNSARNICIACPSCNLSKQDRLPSEWGDRLI